MSLKQYTYDGRPYVLSNNSWYTPLGEKVPLAVSQHLDRLIYDERRAEEDSTTDIDLLVNRAVHYRERKKLERASQLLQRALKIDPASRKAAAALCALLRLQGSPEKALSVTEGLKQLSSPALLTTRAAAFCDLGRWEEAKRVIGKALALGKGDPEAFNVVSRIKSARPGLYSTRIPLP